MLSSKHFHFQLVYPSVQLLFYTLLVCVCVCLCVRVCVFMCYGASHYEDEALGWGIVEGGDARATFYDGAPPSCFFLAALLPRATFYDVCVVNIREQ